MSRWWQGTTGYEVYVRSFADSDGDGIGDLPGVRARLPHLADLGIDVVWLTPFYPSPQRDHGYDVADYLAVEPTYGTLADLDGLLADAHQLGLKVVVDLVPNHTSDQHPWFVDSRSARDAHHRDWYVWRDPAPDGGPPNNWVSHFGGPAWTLDEGTGQYYLHLFLPEQPDLNWAEPAVRAAFEDILEWWFVRGVDGVRIDVAHSLVKDSGFRDNPELVLPEGRHLIDRGTAFERFEHVHDQDQEGVLDIYRDWHRLAARHDAVLLGEVYLLDPDRLARYLEGDALHQSFCFAALRTTWDPDDIRSTLRPYVTGSGDALAWPLSSHDDPRAATRFGRGELGARRALAYLTLLCGLPGSPFLFQGDELGLDDGVLPAGTAEDPIARRNPGLTGRDPQRTPMLWEPGEGFGFTSGTPWLPFGSNRTDAQTVAAQCGDPRSHLERTRQLFRVRRHLPALIDGSPVRWLTDRGPVVAVERGSVDGASPPVVVACNVGDAPATLEVGNPVHLAFATDAEGTVVGGTLRLPADSAAIVARLPEPSGAHEGRDAPGRSVEAALTRVGTRRAGRSRRHR
jgi:alpha-glucosidase